ncbi:MAG: hypothetical protein HY315_09200 [Acidobacteria bacterium]|nr:hypothetical protein [Acidobacteriota bacterium]
MSRTRRASENRRGFRSRVLHEGLHWRGDPHRGPRGSRGVALLLVLVFVGLSMLFLSSLLSTSHQAVIASSNARAALQVRTAVLSGIDWVEFQIRQHDFTDLLRGLNRTAETDFPAARQTSFRNPLARAVVASTDWEALRYSGPDDGLLHDGFSILNPFGLRLNRCKLFFKLSNNPDDPGGPFTDTDDTVLVRIVGAIPAPSPFLGSREIHNLGEIAEVGFRRNSTFLGPSAVYCPAGRLIVDLTQGGQIRGRAESGTGVAVAAAEPFEARAASGDVLDGSPPVETLAPGIYSHPRLRWLTSLAFVDHWKSRIGGHTLLYEPNRTGPTLHWAPAGMEISDTQRLQGIVFARGPVILRQFARIEGLLVLVDSSELQMFDSTLVAGSVTAAAKGATFAVVLHQEARIEYRPALAAEALRLLPLSRTRFRFITPEMEP